MFARTIAVLFVAVLLGWGCSSANRSGSPTTMPSPATAAPTAMGQAGSKAPARAECLVCKRNADLACVEVDVAADTPACVYKGKKYYFCSEECRDNFAKNPQKYAGK